MNKTMIANLFIQRISTEPLIILRLKETITYCGRNILTALC